MFRFFCVRCFLLCIHIPFIVQTDPSSREEGICQVCTLTTKQAKMIGRCRTRIDIYQGSKVPTLTIIPVMGILWPVALTNKIKRRDHKKCDPLPQNPEHVGNVTFWDLYIVGKSSLSALIWHLMCFCSIYTFKVMLKSIQAFL